MRKLLAAGIALCVASAAQAQMRITEYMYSGNDLAASNGEFWELTNVGGSPIDMTGWSFDDDSRTPGTVDLSVFGIVAAGESVVIAEAPAADFRDNWGLPGTVKVLGGNTTNFGRGDEFNLYDALDVLVDRLTYSDQIFSGTFRTQFVSAWVTYAGLGQNDPYEFVGSMQGDLQSSYFGTNGDLGSPGMHVIPEPAMLTVLALGGLALVRRKR